MLSSEGLIEIGEDRTSEWGEEVFLEEEDDLEDLQSGTPSDENDQKGIIDLTGVNPSSRPATTTKSVASSLRSDGKHVRLKHPHPPLYNFSGVIVKRDPVIESIIDSRKFAIIENPYTRLAQVTSQAPRPSQRVSQFDTRPSIVEIEIENKERILSSYNKIKLASSTKSEVDNEGWEEGGTGERERGTSSIDKSSLQLYENTCKRLHICPCSMIIRSLNTTKINLRNYGLGPRGCTALAVGLVRNTTVLSLNLSQNNIGSSGMSHIYQVLMENTYIEDYDLSFNNLGTKGIRKLADGVAHCVQVKTLSVAGNELTANDIQILLSKLEDHANLNNLNISHNQLEEEGGIYLAKWLSDNNVLLHLDISWCSLRLTGAKAIAKAIGDNNKLISIDLSHNSFTNETIDLITNSLTRNMTLCELNLRENQFVCRYDASVKENPLILVTGKDCRLYKMIVAAVTNQSLKIFRLGQNHIDVRCLMIILESLAKVENITLEEFDLTGLTNSANQMSKVDSLFINHPNFTCFVGPVRQTIEHFANILLNLIQTYHEVNDISLSDMFNPNDVLNIPITSVTYEQFLDRLRKCKIPFPIALINDIMKYLGSDNEQGLITLRSLVIS